MSLCLDVINRLRKQRASMSTSLTRLTTRAAYGARQLSRMAWYLGHGAALRRLSEKARREGESKRPRPHTDRPVPDRKSLFADVVNLLKQDRANVEAGTIHCPRIMTAHC